MKWRKAGGISRQDVLGSALVVEGTNPGALPLSADNHQDSLMSTEIEKAKCFIAMWLRRTRLRR